MTMQTMRHLYWVDEYVTVSSCPSRFPNSELHIGTSPIPTLFPFKYIDWYVTKTPELFSHTMLCCRYASVSERRGKGYGNNLKVLINVIDFAQTLKEHDGAVKLTMQFYGNRSHVSLKPRKRMFLGLCLEM